MGRKIVCPECNTVFDEKVLEDKHSENTCLVCGANLSGEEENRDWVTWWYLKDKRFKDDYTLWDKMPNDPENYEIINEFKAPPENNPGGLDAVKDILRTYVPDAFIFPDEPKPQIRCPRCFSTEFQLIPKKFSILTGFATNRFDRVCNHCGKRF